MKTYYHLHWCGHCGQIVPIPHHQSKTFDHTCIGAWFLSDKEYRQALVHIKFPNEK